MPQGSSSTLASWGITTGATASGHAGPDINVVCDLSEHDPNAPTLSLLTQDPPAGEESSSVKNDGTSIGTIPQATLLLFERLIESEMDMVTVYWTGWWPECHVVVN